MSVDDRFSQVRVTIIDVMYAIVAGYGLEAVDAAVEPIDFLLVFFAYFVLVKDWIQEHTRYRDVEFSSIIFVADLAILFTITRMFKYAACHDTWFYGWAACLFLIYLAWDIVLKADITRNGYSWKLSACGDFFGVLSFVSVTYLLTYEVHGEAKIWLMTTAFPIVYGLAFFSWRKRIPNASNPGESGAE